MAINRPWVTPAELKDYSDSDKVRSRADAKLCIDISRAESAVIAYTKNKFDTDTDTELPSDIKSAVILLSEAYALKAIRLTEDKKQSETFDDYSYSTLEKEVSIADLDLNILLDFYVIPESKNNIFMRMRKI